MYEELTDIGNGHHIKYIYDGNTVIEVIEYHFDSEGKMCGGAITFGPEDWELVSDDPCTVRPSIDCDRCLSHGFILHGRWVDHVDPKASVLCAEAWSVSEVSIEP